MKIGDQVRMNEEDLERWPELIGKKLVIWHIEPGLVHIKIGRKKDYYAWDKDWFIPVSCRTDQ